MTGPTIARLVDRGAVSVAGADAHKLLQGLITGNMGDFDHAPAIYAGLLTPQGKILFDFFVVRSGARGDPAPSFLLDVAQDRAADLVKRLQMYRLRAAAAIEDVSANFAVLALWGGSAAAASVDGFYSDPRLPALGWRVVVPEAQASGVVAGSGASLAGADRYHAHRIALGIPEGGKDYAFGDTFPHEALFDQLNGVSFTKGCYVGQEIVARMEHRGTARKRAVPVTGTAALPVPGTPVMAGDIEIGVLGSSAGSRGIALLRIDRAAEFQTKGVPLAAAGVALSIELPPWARFSLPVVSAD